MAEKLSFKIPTIAKPSNVIKHLNDFITMYISNGLRLYFKFTLVRMVRHGATPKRPTIKSPLLIYFAVSKH